TGSNERGQSRKQTKGNQKSANDLHPAAERHQGRKRFGLRAKGAEYLIEPMAGKHQPDDQTHYAIKRVRETIERVHGWSGCTISILCVKAAHSLQIER